MNTQDPAHFDEQGDLWVVVQVAQSFPPGVEVLSFMFSYPSGPAAYGIAATKMNLTKYIKHIVRESYVTGEWKP